MACIKKENTGYCSHAQCPFSHATSHGYECIDIDLYEGELFCEIGDGCLEECTYSFRDDGSERWEKSKRWHEYLKQQAEL